MRVRNITTCALGLAAALSLVSSVSAAQSSDTTRLRRPADQRISISKGEVDRPVIRVDTVYVTRYDTVRVDNTIVRVDTVTVTQTVQVFAPKARGLTYGLYAGATKPIDNVGDLYSTGWHLGGRFGWEPVNRMLGVRLDANYNQLNRESGFTAQQLGTDTPRLLSMSGDLKANFINVGGFALYGVTGLNWYRFKNIATVSDLDSASPPDDPCDFQVNDDDSCYQFAQDRWINKFGWNMGAGTDFSFGRTALFVEGRFMALQSNDERTWTVPISLGLRFR